MPEYKYEPKIRNPLVQPPSIALGNKILRPGDTFELSEQQAGWTPFVNYIEDGWIELSCPDGKCELPKKEEKVLDKIQEVEKAIEDSEKEESKPPAKKTTRKSTNKDADA